MILKKDVLTTGQVAEICNVAPRTVTKWFDDGRLGGYRIPGSRDRRIPVSELIAFMKAHDIPTDGLEKGKLRVLLIDSQAETCRQFAETLEVEGSFDIECAHNSFDAGLLVQKFMPNVILIDLMSNDIDAGHLCGYVRGNTELTDCAVIAMAGGLSENEAANLKQHGYSDVVTDPSNINHILAAIQQTYDILH
ncbi:MAG: helix-turn-helix domain-containing protein [Planctomycetota bacterium]|jgi:excisionase family DNA binding protein